MNEVDVLVFVVDSADQSRLPFARQELHRLLDKDPDLPVVVVANKQVRGVQDEDPGRCGGNPDTGLEPGGSSRIWGSRLELQVSLPVTMLKRQVGVRATVKRALVLHTTAGLIPHMVPWASSE